MVPQVWLGDLLRAIAAGADPHDAAELLGLVARRDCVPPADAGPPEPVPPSGADRPKTAEPLPDQSGSTSHTPPRAVPMLPELSRGEAGRSDWTPGPSLPLPAADQSPEPTPLLAPRTTAAVLHTLLATTAPDGDPDVEAVARLWAQGKPVQTLPRTVRPTLRFGVQVLVDIGEAMQLFSRDQSELVAHIRTVAGTEFTSVSYFADVPARGVGRAGRRTWRDYTPPSIGSRVLILSDFGIGGPSTHDSRSTPAEWRDFISAVRKADCFPVGLVPYPSSRWPAWLTSSMPLLLWDRTTTTSDAAVAVRR